MRERSQFGGKTKTRRESSHCSASAAALEEDLRRSRQRRSQGFRIPNLGFVAY